MGIKFRYEPEAAEYGGYFLVDASYGDDGSRTVSGSVAPFGETLDALEEELKKMLDDVREWRLEFDQGIPR